MQTLFCLWRNHAENLNMQCLAEVPQWQVTAQCIVSTHMTKTQPVFLGLHSLQSTFPIAFPLDSHGKPTYPSWLEQVSLECWPCQAQVLSCRSSWASRRNRHVAEGSTWGGALHNMTSMQCHGDEWQGTSLEKLTSRFRTHWLGEGVAREECVKRAQYFCQFPMAVI
jgi:hypothetical protein